MRIVTWNCNGAFRKKFHEIIKLEADIYIIQECEDPNLTKDQAYKNWAANHLWLGDNKNKGIGIFSNTSYKLERLNWSNQFKDHTVKHFLPCLVNQEFQLLAVWTHLNNSPTFGYIGQFWKYLQTNKMQFKNIIIAGDFNSNVIWDKWDRWWNHSDVTNELAKKGIISVYHYINNEEQGKESKPTFFLQRNVNKPYHIDYFYLNKSFIKSGASLTIGKQSKWLEISDHLPIALEIEFDASVKTS